MRVFQTCIIICCILLTSFMPANGQDVTSSNDKIIADLKIDCNCIAKWNFDGSLLAVSAGTDIQIWDTDRWNLLITIPEAYAYYDMAWHPNKNQIATVQGGKQERVMIWDATTGEVVINLSRPVLSQNGGLAILHALAWSPDGSKIATDSDYVDSLLMWDLMSDSLPEVLIASNYPQRPYFRIYEIEWSNNGKMLLLSGADEIQNAGTLPVIRIWDVENKKALRPMYSGGKIKWGSGDTQFANIYFGEIVAIWDVETGEIIKYANTPGDNQIFLSWNQSENLIASMNINGDIKIWDVNPDGLFIAGYTSSRNASSIDWKSNSTQLAIAGKDGVVIWNFER